MKAPRLHELTARVVAWHNRHPLARRIDATQVHSIGEVRLPFASATPWGDAPAAEPEAPPPPPAAAGPKLAEALAQRTARQQAGTSTPGIDGLDVQSMLPDADAALFDTPTRAPAAATDIDLALDAEPADTPADTPGASPDSAAAAADGETALVIPLLDGDDAPPAAPDETDAASAEPPPANGEPPAPAADLDLDAAASTAAPTDTEASAQAGDANHGAAAPAAATAPDLTDAPPPPPDTLPVLTDAVYPPPHGVVPASSLARAVERRAAARGAGGHAAPDIDLPAPPASRWRRLLAALRRAFTGRQPGLPPLRAAFSREFIWPLRTAQVARWAQRHGQPQPLAPADWPHRSIDADRARLAQLRQKGLAHDLPLHVLTAAIGVGDRRIRVLVGADGSILGPRAYHPTRVGGVCMVLAVGLVGLGWSLRPLHGLPDDDAAAAAMAAASAPVAAVAASAASAADTAASATALAHAASAADAAASAAHAAGPAEPAASAANDAAVATAANTAASQPQASIRPTLSDEERYAAKVEAARLRGEPVPPPPATLLPGPVYAVVGPASRQRAAAAGSLAQMKSAASGLDGSAPEHGELVESQGQWRAAWWPFTSLVDAERARVLLAGRGIKAEVVEF
jgi:trimeric autotransporter adhesin